MDWSLVISACALALSVWNTFARWNDKQPRIFISDAYILLFGTSSFSNANIRIDLTINAMSSEPTPISHIDVSMDTRRWFCCSCCPPTPGKKKSHTEADNIQYQRADAFFGSSIRLPATLPPSSAQHICLWLTLPVEDELLSSLKEASVRNADQEESSMPYTNQTHPSSLCEAPDCLYVRMRSGNQILSSTVPIDSRSFPLFLD